MKKSIAFSLILIFTTHTINSQKKAAQQDTIFNQKVVLEREFNPIFRDASRIEIMPQITEPKTEKAAIKYQFSRLDTTFPIQWNTLPPEKKMDSFDYSTQTAFVNLGLGLPANSFLNGSMEILNDKKNHLSASIDHRSIKDNRTILQTDEKQSVYSADTKVNLNYSRPFDLFLLDASTAFTHSNFNYFGYSGNITLNPSASTEQTNNVFNIQAHAHSVEGSEIEYTAGFQYNYFDKKSGSISTINGSKEHNLLIEGDFKKTLTKKTLVGLETSLNNFIYTKDTAAFLNEYQPQNSGHLKFAPYYELVEKNYKIRAGLKSEFAFYNHVKAYFAPVIDGLWEFTPKFFALVNISGGTQMNSFSETDVQCRYLNPGISLHQTFTPLDALLSLKSNVIPRLEVELSTGFKSGDEYYFSSRKIQNTNYLFPAALTNTKQYKVGFLAKYELKDLGDITLKLNKYQYHRTGFANATNDAAIAWDKPSFEMSLDGDFKVNEKINVQLNYYLASGRYGLEDGLVYNSVKLNAINQLNLSGRYTFDKRWSAFAQMNNILLQKYDLWLGMPAQNFNFVLGAGFSY
ncbi:MAG: hypothetical protein WCJ03_04360 [Bacteroidales bacterium]